MGKESRLSSYRMRCVDRERAGRGGQRQSGAGPHKPWGRFCHRVGISWLLPFWTVRSFDTSLDFSSNFASSADGCTCLKMGWCQLPGHSLVKRPCMVVSGCITWKRIRGSHILSVVPEVRGCLSMKETPTPSTLPETLCLFWSSQERTSRPSDQREELKSLSQRESAIPSKCFCPAQFIKPALCRTKRTQPSLARLCCS